jgi:hypothetical protein
LILIIEMDDFNKISVSRFHRKRKGPYPRTTERDGNSIIFDISIYDEYIKNPDSLKYVFAENHPLPMNANDLNLDYTIIESLSNLNIDTRIIKTYRKIDYRGYRYYEYLRMNERIICNTLRIPPEKYFTNLVSIITASRKINNFKKTHCQKACINLDVNKASILYDLFIKFGWIINN